MIAGAFYSWRNEKELFNYMVRVFFLNKGSDLQNNKTTKQNSFTNGKKESVCKSANERKFTNDWGRSSLLLYHGLVTQCFVQILSKLRNPSHTSFIIPYRLAVYTIIMQWKTVGNYEMGCT